MKLSIALNKICKEKGITLSKVAKESGVPLQTLHGWTEGRKAVNLEHLRKVAHFLELPVYQLIYGENDPFETKDELLKEIFSGDIRVTLHRIEKKRVLK